MVIFMPEIKCSIFQDLQETLTNMHIGIKFYLWYAFAVQHFFKEKYILGVHAMKILLIYVFFSIL